MIYGDIHQEKVTLTESELQDIDDFYDSGYLNESVCMDDSMSLGLLSYKVYAEMQYNSIITTGFLQEAGALTEGAAQTAFDWFVNKINYIIDKVSEFISSAWKKVKYYFAQFQQKFTSKMNSTKLLPMIPSIKELMFDASEDELNKFPPVSITNYRTNVSDIDITGAYTTLDNELKDFYAKVETDRYPEKALEEALETLKTNKEKIKARFMQVLYSSIVRQMNIGKDGNPLVQFKGKHGNISRSLTNDGMDFTRVTPSDTVDFNSTVGKVNSTGGEKEFEAAQNDIKAFADKFFVSRESTVFGGKDVVAHFDTICDAAFGKEKNAVVKNFKDMDRRTQITLKDLKNRKNKIVKALNKNNDHTSQIKYEILINLLNHYQTAQIYAQTLIISHSAAVVSKMSEYNALLMSFKRYLEKK